LSIGQQALLERIEWAFVWLSAVMAWRRAWQKPEKVSRDADRKIDAIVLQERQTPPIVLSK
jgi:hypothetical protein